MRFRGTRTGFLAALTLVLAVVAVDLGFIGSGWYSSWRSEQTARRRGFTYVSARRSQSWPVVYAPRIELILGAETANAPAAWCGGAAVAGTAEAV